MALRHSNIDVHISSDLVPLLDDLAHGNSVNDNVRVSIAISLFVSKTVSLARAAEIAELSLNDFIYTLKVKKIPWGEYSDEDIVQDDIAVKDLLRELGEEKNG
jgi:predicted HTH domain antitoxin